MKVLVTSSTGLTGKAVAKALAMFRSYNRYGFLGNDFDTRSLLPHRPTTFYHFIQR